MFRMQVNLIRDFTQHDTDVVFAVVNFLRKFMLQTVNALSGTLIASSNFISRRIADRNIRPLLMHTK